MSDYRISQHHLFGPQVSQQPSPNHSGEFRAGHADMIVMHFTAGSSLASSVRALTDPDNQVSAHIVIGREGQIVQLLPFNIIGWHAGKSEWQGRQSLNQYAIGIELDNAGELTPNGEGQFLSWFNKAYTKDAVFLGQHRNQSVKRYWHAYTEAQIQATFSLCQLLCRTYPIEAIVGHEEIAPQRKVDPGPAFPLDKLRQRMLGVEPAPVSQPIVPQLAVVTASKLNVRGGPGSNQSLIGEPLPRGTKVTVLSQTQGWAQVEYTTTGWVSRRYLQDVDSHS